MMTPRQQKALRVISSALIVWLIGVTAFVCSYFIPVMENPDLQANLVLALTLIPATALGAAFFYKKGFRTNGWLLGIFMFGVTVLLDASITVPVFIIPEGGNHVEFFRDPVFWLIGVEYIGLIALFSQMRRKPEEGQEYLRDARFSFVPPSENANPGRQQAVRFYFPRLLTRASS